MCAYFKTLTTERITYLSMDNGKSNALHMEMLDEFAQLLQQAADDPAVEALILEGKQGFFSSGLDLITLYDYDAAAMQTFWEKFMDLLLQLWSFPKPSVAAISGHSPAGGCVLALCCDYRVMAEGDFIIGLNEVPVGIVVPSSIFELYSFWIGQAQAYRFLLEGKLLRPQEALAVGLVDEVVLADRLQTAATRKVKSVMQFEQHAWRTTKQNLRQALSRQMELAKAESITQVLEQWWRPSTRTIINTIITNLTQKRHGN